MKHLKTYENSIKNNYKKGDFVMVNNGESAFKLPYGKILKKYPGKAKDRFIDTYSVKIIFPNTEHWTYQPNEINYTNIPQYTINRKLSKEEVAELKIKINTEKYNL